jgi:hypothetical protein
LVKHSVTPSNQIESRFCVLSGDSEHMPWVKGVALVLPYIVVCVE